MTPWGYLEPPGSIFYRFFTILGSILGPFWEYLEPLGGVFGSLRGSLGTSWVVLGSLRRFWNVFWLILFVFGWFQHILAASG